MYRDNYLTNEAKEWIMDSICCEVTWNFESKLNELKGKLTEFNERVKHRDYKLLILLVVFLLLTSVIYWIWNEVETFLI